MLHIYGISGLDCDHIFYKLILKLISLKIEKADLSQEIINLVKMYQFIGIT
jgi:hypothetical protein